jgi:hypothetical protein
VLIKCSNPSEVFEKEAGIRCRLFLNVNLVKLDNHEYGEHVGCAILMLYK